MKRLFQTETSEAYLNIALLVLRISLAALMVTHGLPKLIKLLEGGDIQFANPISLSPGVSLALVVFAEFFCSVLIGIGLGTRLASIPLMITMGVAAFITHGADPFARKELAILYLLFYLILLVLGSGKYSMDHLLTKKRDQK
jgi:putative oxidoreductase